MKQIGETDSYLSNLISTRNSEAESFDASTEAYKKNSAAADEALEILEQIWSGESTFLELAKHANKMLMNAIQIKKVSKLTPVMAALAQLASKKLIADDSLLKQVQGLLRDFRSNIENDFVALSKAEETAIRVFNDNKARTEEFLASLNNAKKDLEVEQAKLGQCISNQNSILITANAKLERNQNLLDSALKMCDSFHKEFVAASESRHQELELIEVIKQKVEVRYGALAPAVKERVSKEFFDAHRNENAYQNASFQHKQAEYGENGAKASGYERNTAQENF